MKPAFPPPARNGATLIEALVAILIFSIGILAVVGLQAVSVKNAATAKYRTEAAMLADQVIGEMWGDDKNALQTNYNTGGPKYLVWKTQVEAALPGAGTSPPTISVGAGNVIIVTVYWQEPGETIIHNVALTAQVNT